MWDRLITDCHVATMVAQPGNPLGLFPNAAIGVDVPTIVASGTERRNVGFVDCRACADSLKVPLGKQAGDRRQIPANGWAARGKGDQVAANAATIVLNGALFAALLKSLGLIGCDLAVSRLL